MVDREEDDFRDNRNDNPDDNNHSGDFNEKFSQQHRQQPLEIREGFYSFTTRDQALLDDLLNALQAEHLTAKKKITNSKQR